MASHSVRQRHGTTPGSPISITALASSGIASNALSDACAAHLRTQIAARLGGSEEEAAHDLCEVTARLYGLLSAVAHIAEGDEETAGVTLGAMEQLLTQGINDADHLKLLAEDFFDALKPSRIDRQAGAR